MAVLFMLTVTYAEYHIKFFMLTVVMLTVVAPSPITKKLGLFKLTLTVTTGKECIKIRTINLKTYRCPNNKKLTLIVPITLLVRRPYASNYYNKRLVDTVTSGL